MDLAGGFSYVGQEVRTGFAAQGQPMETEDADVDRLSSDEEKKDHTWLVVTNGRCRKYRKKMVGKMAGWGKAR